jgi:hypothetical protein
MEQFLFSRVVIVEKLAFQHLYLLHPIAYLVHLTIPHTLRTLQSLPINCDAPCNLHEPLRPLSALVCHDYLV